MTTGNGDTGSQLHIVVEERRPDWVVIRPALSEFRKEVGLERLPGQLDRTLTAWLTDHPPRQNPLIPDHRRGRVHYRHPSLARRSGLTPGRTKSQDAV